MYQPLEETSMKLLYGSAFRAPTHNELHANSEFVTGNPNLKPETVETYEAILIQKISSSSLSIGYFDSRIKDIIVSAAANTVQTFENQDEQRFSGIEAELSSEFLDGDLSTRFGVGHITHSDQTKKITPETTISGIINYRFNNALNFTLNGFYHSPTENYYETGSNKLDPYTIINTKLSYHLTSRLICFLEVENIFDENYKTPSVIGSSGFEVSNRGRLGYIGFEYRF